jgi:hypothetical protein
MATTRPELTPEHRTQLRDFIQLVFTMNQCRFMKKYREQDHCITSEQVFDGVKVSAPDYDWDDFQAFMMAFRKVGIAERESTYLTKIYNLVGRYASDQLRRRLKEQRKQVMLVIDGYWTGMLVGGKIDGKEKLFNTAELLDMVTNGMLFHQDELYREAVAMFGKEPNWAYLMPMLACKVMPIHNISVWLFDSFWRDGILGVADYPEEWQKLKQAWDAEKK